jgi:hypothetical protein
MPDKNTAKNSRKLTRKEVRELDIKISFMAGIVRRDPRYVEALQILVDKQLSRLEPGNPLVFYNLACSHSLNGELERAAQALDRALKLGYRDFKWLAKDPDLRRLRKHPLYRPIEDKIRRMKVKIA